MTPHQPDTKSATPANLTQNMPPTTKNSAKRPQKHLTPPLYKNKGSQNPSAALAFYLPSDTSPPDKTIFNT